MHRAGLLAGALLFAGLLPVAPAASHSGSDRVDVDDHVETDTYVLSITVSGDVELAAGSQIAVRASYTGSDVSSGGAAVAAGEPLVFARPDVTFQNASRQHGSALVAFLEETNLGTEAATEDTSTDFQRAFGASVNDLTDARLTLRQPQSLQAERDPQIVGLNGFRIDVQWSNDHTLHGPDTDAAEVTYRLLLSVPEAQWIDVEGHLHLSPPGNLTGTSSIGDDGGFLYVGEDFTYDQRIETGLASAARNGEATHDFQPAGEEYLYAHVGPSGNGHTATQATLFGSPLRMGATTPNAAVGDYRITEPDGDTHEVPKCAGAAGESVRCQFSIASSNGPSLTGATDPGIYTFEVDHQAGATAEDVFATGYAGPLE